LDVLELVLDVLVVSGKATEVGEVLEGRLVPVTRSEPS
jgi:hypothetical protein